MALVAGAIVWGAGVFGHYGWFTDELYFLSCAHRPALGYVDHPPLATLLLAAVRAITFDNLALIRLVPAGVFAACIVLVGRLAHRLGGGAFAQTLAAAIFATAPAVLVIAGFYSMNPLELLFAILLARFALAVAASPRAWLGFGLVTGLAFLNKHSIVLPAALLAGATLLSPARSQLATRWPCLGLGLALLVAAPNLAWLVANDGITFEFYRISVPLKNIHQSPLEAVVGQAMFVGPLAFGVAVLGALALARQPAHRGFALAFAIALAIMMASGISRADRILALYPLLFAAGACALERATRIRRWTRILAVGVLVIGAVPPLPLVLPILPPALVVRYSTALAVTPELEVAKRGAMPQWLGDKRGWPELVATTTAIARALPERHVVFASDYGSAGALELAGVPVISTHNEFWRWGPGAIDGATIVAVGRDRAFWDALYTDVRQTGTVRCEGCLVDGTPIWVVRGDRPGLAARWDALRRFE